MGNRSKDQIRSVGPNEIVRINEEGNPIVESRTKIPENLVLTPGGFRHPSLVHTVEPGHTVRLTGDRIQMISPSEDVVADFAMPEMVRVMASGWISDAYWDNNTGAPITYFATTFVVPPAPVT